jgi:DNA-3-methyladenine glycosylase II
MPHMDEPTLHHAIAAIAAADPDLARVRRLLGPPGLRARAPGFAALLNIIVAQQVSRASAEAIWGRLEAACRPLVPDRFLKLSDDAYREIGLSRQKIRYARGLAEALVGGAVDLDRVAALDDDDAVAELVTLKGIGRWSAEIYLLSSLGRPDVWPADDLALMIAVQRLKRLDDRPDRARMLAVAEPWRPWRSVAARLLWHYYRHGDGMEAAR